MRKIVASEFISLDGVVEAPETWHFPYVDDEAQAYSGAQIDSADAFVYGRKTYDIFSSFWPTATEPRAMAQKFNNTPKFVVSTTLQKADWQGTTIIRGIDELAKIKQDGSGIMATTGSVTLIQALLKAGLLDELHLLVHPIIVGHGKRLFDGGMDTIPLKLVDSRTFKLGIVALTFQPEKKG